MTALASLPPQAVLPLGRRRVETLRRAAQTAGHRWLHADCAGAADKAGTMAALAAGLALPDWFGANLDALYDCLTDLEPLPDAPAPGLVLVVEHLPASPGLPDDEREALLDVFRDAADRFAERGVAFRTFWSLSGPARARS
ncbi:MAG: barstar family protein [Burkholderiales bacterium]|jgi:RNAse (barnase) inhibitor barstar